jgi:hypothetical protein
MARAILSIAVLALLLINAHAQCSSAVRWAACSLIPPHSHTHTLTPTSPSPSSLPLPLIQSYLSAGFTFSIEHYVLHVRMPAAQTDCSGRGLPSLCLHGHAGMQVAGWSVRCTAFSGIVSLLSPDDSLMHACQCLLSCSDTGSPNHLLWL